MGLIVPALHKGLLIVCGWNDVDWMGVYDGNHMKNLGN